MQNTDLSKYQKIKIQTRSTLLIFPFASASNLAQHGIALESVFVCGWSTTSFLNISLFFLAVVLVCNCTNIVCLFG